MVPEERYAGRIYVTDLVGDRTDKTRAKVLVFNPPTLRAFGGARQKLRSDQKDPGDEHEIGGHGKVKRRTLHRKATVHAPTPHRRSGPPPAEREAATGATS